MDPAGRSLTFTYNGTGQMTRLDLPDGQHLTFAYDLTNDQAANLASVTYPNGSSIGYRYNESGYVAVASLHALTGAIDEKGVRYGSTTYDSSIRAKSSSFAGGTNSYSAVYQNSTDGTYFKTATITNPLGSTETLNFSVALNHVLNTSQSIACSGCVTKTATNTFDAQGRPDLATDFAGATTDFDYDATGLLT